MTTKKEQLEKTLSEYLALASRSDLYPTGIYLIENLADLQASDDAGRIFYPEKRPKRIKVFRPIAQDELDAMYSSINKLMEEGCDAIRKNLQLGVAPKVGIDDLAYKIDQGVMESFDTFSTFYENYHRTFQSYFVVFGGYGTGKRR